MNQIPSDEIVEGSVTSTAMTVMPPSSTSVITPFKINVPQSALDDLKRRLEMTRWPTRETVSDWSQGVPLARVRALVDYWRTTYDWRRCEAMLNAFGPYRTEIEGLGIHFLHVRSRHPNALPLVLSHGWPGSVLEFAKVIGPLTDSTGHGGKADDAFHVVIPSLPGFGFSDQPTGTGWNVERTASAWAELMRRLGYMHYAAQGGDWGAGITTHMAQLEPEGLVGIHLNWPLVIPAHIPTAALSVDEQVAVEGVNTFLGEGSGYFRAQATRPQTIGYSLADSPVGQLAWIYDKFHDWTDSHGDPENVLTKDEILDDVMLYWLPDTAASSARFYWENRDVTLNMGPVEKIPVACSIFPHEIYRAPRRWAEQTYKQLIYWHELDRGGHFAALEQPELFVHELRAAFHQPLFREYLA
jgi:pimeloyl-ACP methyl ester carboxylesterase